MSYFQEICLCMFPKKSVCSASRRGSFGIEDCSFRQRIFHMRSARPEYEVRVCKNSLWRQHVQNKRLFFLCKVIVLEVDGVQLLPQLRRISLGYSALGRISPCRYTGLWARLRNSVTPAIASMPVIRAPVRQVSLASPGRRCGCRFQMHPRCWSTRSG